MNWLPYLSVVFLPLLALCIGLVVRRAALRSRRPLRSRYLVQWVSVILLFAVEVAFTADIVRRGFNLRSGFALAAIAVALGISIWRLRRLRSGALDETAAPSLKRRSSFLGQAALILLPVAIMAAIGLAAIVRDRAAVENEAKQQAEEILRSLPAEFGRDVAARMNEFAPLTYNWAASQLHIWAAWPESQERKWWLTNNASFLREQFVAWHAAFPDLRAEDVLPVHFSFNSSGELQDIGYRNPPEPPAWFVALTPEQRRAWLGLVLAEHQRGSNIDLLAEAFLRTEPPPQARAGAEFIRLRDELRTRPGTNAVEKLIRFANRGHGSETESGVPLSNLVVAEALRQAGETGLDEPLWNSLQREVAYRPSILTPSLLGEAQHLVAHDESLSEALNALRALWGVDQVRIELAEAVKRTGKLNGITPTNLWIDALERRWFCTVQPNEQISSTQDSNHSTVTLTNMLTEVRPYVQPLVARGFAEALRDAKVALPGYFGVSVALEGEPVMLPSPWGKNGSGQPPGKILAEMVMHLSLPAALNGRPFESMPSHPGFALRLHLVDRSLLFAAQRQRTLLFGGLIIASAFAALTGAFAARRAFSRQLRLNEMKSNFVSSVSHELRAPIASVRLMAESLERGKVSEPAKQNEYFGFIVQECRRLSSLIENVLDFSRIEQGRKQYEFEPTDLVALTRETVKLMEPYAAEKGVRLVLNAECGVRPSSLRFDAASDAAGRAEAEGEGGSAELEVDGRAIQQALVNLIDNAIKHSPKGETVTVGIEVRGQRSEAGGQRPETGILDAPRTTHHAASVEDEGRVRGRGRFAAAINPQPSTLNLFVDDRGPGIPPEEHEKIFERFYRRGSELRRETQGVGIGLSIVKHIVEAHGGRVVVRSAVGQGSRFTIEIPVEK